MTSHDRKVNAGLERLGAATLAVGLAGAVAASRVAPAPIAAQLDETGRLLREIRQDAGAPAPRVAGVKGRNAPTGPPDDASPWIEQLAKVANWTGLRALAGGACVAPGQPAELFISTGPVYKAGGAGSVTLEIWGSLGGNHFAFASGTQQVHIVDAINSLAHALGISVALSQEDPGRIRISSSEASVDGFVRVRQTGGLKPIIFDSAASQAGSHDLKDWGTDAIVLSTTLP